MIISKANEFYGKLERWKHMSEKPDVTMGEMTKTNGTSGRKVPKKIIWTIGAVAVAAIILIIGICSGAFLSRSNRILLAARNTIKDLPTVVENRNVADIIASGKYTIGVKGAVRGKDFDGTFKYKDTQLQAGGTISLFGRENLDFLANLDDEQLCASIPMLTDNLLVYNYKEEKDGYIVDLLGADGVASIDAALRELTSKEEQNRAAQEILSVIYDEYKTLDIKKAEKEEFIVDGSVRKCNGYEFTVTEDELLQVMNGVKEVYDAYYGGVADALKLKLGDDFSQLRDRACSMGDINVKVYVYQNKLAAVVTEAENSDTAFHLLFKGGEYRMQNLELIAEDLEGEHSILELTGKAAGEEGGYEFLIDNGEHDINLVISISGEVQFEKMSGDRIDVGNMSEADLRKFILRTVGTIITSHIR